MRKLKSVSYFMMVLLVFGSFAPFATAAIAKNPTSNQGFAETGNYGSTTNRYQSSQPNFDNFYSGSMSTYWPILTRLKNDQCNATTSDFVIAIPPFGCSPQVVRSDLLAEQNVPVFCQLSAIKVNPLIDVSTIKSISFKGDYPDEVAGISFHPARAAAKSYKNLLGSPIEENIGYVVIVLKKHPDERTLEEYVSGMLTATVKYDAQGTFGTGSGEYYLEPVSDEQWVSKAAESSFWGGKGYLRVTNVDSNEATIEVLKDKDNAYRTITLKEGETSPSIYYPGYYCTASLKLKLNKIDNSEDMARIDVDGDSYWVRKGSRFLDKKCVVKNLNVFPNGGGDIEISCSGSSAFKLMLSDRGVVLNNFGGKKEDVEHNVNVMIGGAIKGGGDNLYYLGYYGKNNIIKDETNNPEGDFVVLFDKALTQDEVSRVTGVFDKAEFKTEKDFLFALDNKKIFRKDGKYEIIYFGGEDDGWGITFVSTDVGLSGGKYKDESLVPKYMKEAERAVLNLTEEFPAEKKENGEYWGEDALYKQIALAGVVEDEAMQLELINLFLDKYPGSKNVDYFRDLKVKLGKYNYEGSSINLLVNNENYNIRVDGFASGGGDSESVDLRIGSGAVHKLRKGAVYIKGNYDDEVTDKERQKEVPRLEVLEIDGKGARFSYDWWKDDKAKKDKDSKTFRVEVGSYVNVGGETFHVTGVDVREVAHVSLIPEVRNTKTEANFTFNIGIEKRAIELSPEEARKKVKALNRSIAEWEGRVEKLGELVKGLKGACFAVSTVLMFKSMFAGFLNGEAMARKDVMDYYEKECRKEGFSSSAELQRCYSKYKDDIEAAVKAHGSNMVAVNKDVECAEKTEGTVKSGISGKEVANHKLYVDSLKKCVDKSLLSEGWSVKVNGQEIKRGDLKDAGDIQAVLLKERACATNPSSVDCKIANETMQKQLYDNVEIAKAEDAAKKIKEKFGADIPAAEHPNKDAKSQPTISAKGVEKIKGVNPENYLAQVYAPDNRNERYIVEVNKEKQIVNIYDSEGTKATACSIKKDGVILKGGALEKFVEGVDNYCDTSNADVKEALESQGAEILDVGVLNKQISNLYNFKIPGTKDSSCSNTMSGAYVKYHEKLNKQGFVAVVPFDGNGGWYAFVEEKDYSDAGAAKAFWICNVGVDGLIDDGDTSKDKCQYFQTSSAGSISNFIPCPSLSSSDVKKLFTKAESAIRDANRRGSGVMLDGKFVSKTTPYRAASMGASCDQFMAVEDCNLMFNVCDPVICPTSRCNFGGSWPVNDVIASGIIGSLVLCLPNFGSPSEGKVAIPICLSGVHAGLDTYVSILKGYRDCLEKNIETGQYVGICDEITSIYLCEFFWGQLSPILDTILVRLVESLYGGFQLRGGAEYLTVQESFKNLDASINYFTSTYAKGAFRAFTLRNTEEIGSMVCKGFVGTSVPTSADLIDSLLEPESPTQFHAFFSESVFTEATVPSTSHYKVYYNIYAGNDAGTQFQVFLKSPPESSYYASRQTLRVNSGYIAKGESASETIDFTAPSGYKELCVNINGQDKCGFGKVGSSFALDYVSQAYIKDQADDRQITKTEDCVTTSTSLWGMATPNIQAGVEKSLGGADIATSGIIRICASTNPQAGVVAGNVVYCNPSATNEEKKTNPKCSSGYSCEPMKAEDDEAKVDADMGICTSGTGEKQVSTGRWEDVGYCDEPSVRCWLDVTSVEKNLGLYMAVENITNINEIVKNAEQLKDVKDQYKSAREKINAQRGKIAELAFEKDVLQGKDKEEKEAGIEREIKDIIKALNEVSGLVEEYAGQGSNADKAEALALKASVYMKVVELLIENNPDMKVRGASVVTVSTTEEEGVTKKEETSTGSQEVTVESLTSLMIAEDGCDCGDNCGKYAGAIKTYSEQGDVKIDPLLILAVMIQESGCKHIASNKAGSYGLMQLQERTFKDICEGRLSESDILWDNLKIGLIWTDQNIECGIKILKKKYEDYKDGVLESWAYKNAGKGGFGEEVMDCIDNEIWTSEDYKNYRNWDAALRGYNGWGCGEDADVEYVEKVNDIYKKLQGAHGEVKKVGVAKEETAGEATDVTEIKITFIENWGIDDVFQYRWEEGKVKSQVDIKKVFGGSFCKWSFDCKVDKVDSQAKEIHEAIIKLKQEDGKTWEDVVKLVMLQKNVFGDKLKIELINERSIRADPNQDVSNYRP